MKSVSVLVLVALIRAAGAAPPSPATDHKTCDSVKDKAKQDACHACVSTGRTYQRGTGTCTGDELDDKSGPPITDAAGCQGKTVTPERRKACTACMKSDFHVFDVIGPTAGECSTDGNKFAAKFALQAESLAAGFYTEDGCARNVSDKKQQAQCVACARKDQVFVIDGKKTSCLKPAAAAKRAPRAATAPKSATTAPAVPQDWFSKDGVQEKVGDTTVLRLAGPTHPSSAAFGPIVLEPNTTYTLRVKVRGVGTKPDSLAGAKLEYYLTNGHQRMAGWLGKTDGAYAGAGEWKVMEQTLTTPAETATAATDTTDCKTCFGGSASVWARFAKDDTGSFLFDDFQIVKPDGANLVVNGDFEKPEPRIKGKSPAPLPAP